MSNKTKQYELKEIRKKFLDGMSQEDLAHKLGMTVACWNYKENYKRELKADELLDLATLANIDPYAIKVK